MSVLVIGSTNIDIENELKEIGVINEASELKELKRLLAENYYSFGLLPHSEQERSWLADELMNLRGIRADEMSAILSTYNVNESEIYIIPWQPLYSSYWLEWLRIRKDEDPDAKRQAYVEYVRQMLFPAS